MVKSKIKPRIILVFPSKLKNTPSKELNANKVPDFIERIEEKRCAKSHAS